MHLVIPNYAPSVIKTDGELTIWGYRGAAVLGVGRYNRLSMAGHPADGTYEAFPEACFQMIDFWLDHGELPLCSSSMLPYQD